MTETEFGKDFGLVHEVIVTGRKIGFTRNDWAIAAHNDRAMRAALNGLRRGESNPPFNGDPEQGVAKLVELIVLLDPFFWMKKECIACVNNQPDSELGRKNGQIVIDAYDKVGMVIDEFSKSQIQKGKCFRPIDMVHVLIKELLGVEAPSSDPSGNMKMFPLRGSFDLGGYSGFELMALITPATSTARIIGFAEGLRARGIELKVRLGY